MKRSFRAWTAGLMGAVLACSAAVNPIIGVVHAEEAASPYDGDLDGDGVVSMSDVLILGKYLS